MNFVYVDKEPVLIKALDYLSSGDVWFVDTETTPKDIRLFQVGLESGPIYVIDFFFVKRAPDLIKDIIAKKGVVGHNLKYDLKYLMKYDIHPYTTFDTMIGAQLIGLNRVSLVSVYNYFTGESIDKKEQSSNWSSKELTESQIFYAAKDVEVLRLLYEKLKNELNKEPTIVEILQKSRVAKVFGLESAHAIIEMGFVQELAKIEHTGIGIDTKEIEAMKKQLQRKTQELAMNFYIKYRIDISSSKKVGEFLENHLNISLPRTDKDNIITDDSVLAEYLDSENEKAKDVISSVLEFRKLHKLQEKLSEILEYNENNRVHPEFWQIGAVTGRMSSSRPNVQNIPRELRSILKAKDGYVFVIADFSQIELRIAAEYVKDEIMIDIINKGEDLHKFTASLITGKSLEDITKEERQRAKAANFGLIYGISEKSLSLYARNSYGVDMSIEEAKRFREVFFSTFQGIKAWHERIKKELKAKGEIRVKTLGGKPMIAYTFTDAANYPIQGTGAELLKLSVLIFSQELKRAFPSIFHEVANVVNLVHDEIVVEAKEDYKEEVSKLLEKSMIKAGSILLNNVKVEAEIVINDRWVK